MTLLKVWKKRRPSYDPQRVEFVDFFVDVQIESKVKPTLTSAEENTKIKKIRANM